MLNMIDADELQSIRNAADSEAERLIHDALADADPVASLLTVVLADIHFLVTIISVALSREIRNGNDANARREV
jgi:hypothetical protein